ncbi:transcription factor HES-1-B-like [Liolophura sinensis]|uniref:transcription factor HES-1-B-like n=1 Tax=Liolophura sinensis TaxID=3198878 RepID=UPI0031596C04
MGDEPSSPSGQGGSDRKITKPLMEKRRRARINSCLTELKALLLTNADEKESGRFAKLEKADILELTVKYLRTKQQTAICGNHTALYRAGFNKCMEELSTFLGADDENSTNLRLKLTTHLADILCSMERLKNASSKGHSERSNVSPGLQVSSSSDDVTSAPSLSEPAAISSCVQATVGIEGKSPDGSTAESPAAQGCQPCQVNRALPLAVNSNGSLFPTTFGQVESSAASIPAYTTIPLVPTVLAQGQVLLLVPNTTNNNNSKIGFQLPALTSSALGNLCSPRDKQPIVQSDSSRFTSFICPTSFPKNSLVFNDINESKSVPLHIIKPEPVIESAESTCARQLCTESVRTGQVLSTANIGKTDAKSETKEERCLVSPAVSQSCDTKCTVRNSDSDHTSSDPHGAMWRPW